MTLPEEVRLTDEEKKLAIKGTRIDYFVDMAAKEVVDSVADAQLSKVQKWLESHREDCKADYNCVGCIDFPCNKTYSQTPDGLREKIVGLSFQAYTSEKKSRWIDLANAVHTLYQPLIEQAKKKERERLFKEIENHSADCSYRESNERVIEIPYIWWQSLKEKEV